MRCLLITLLAGVAGVASADWPAFRGDGSSAALDGSTPPTAWSVETGENVAWTADLPGRGVSGPIVVNGRVLVTASDGPNRERLHLLCFDQETGHRLWTRRLWATGRTNCHEASANAAPTPASDGQRVFVFFSSNDLAAFDLTGRMLWMRGLYLDHPRVANDIGMASSPAVVGDAVVVQAECQGESFALAVDRHTGATLWEVERPRASNWASPLAWATSDGRPAVWLQDGQGASLHDAATGERLARIDAGGGGIPSPSRGADGALVLAARGINVYTAPFEEPLQRISKFQPGSPSPVVAGQRVLVVNRGGVLACGDLESGDTLWRRRLGGSFWATPVVAGGRVYCVNDKGEATVVGLDDGKVVSEADFGEDVLGSPAVSGDALYVRSSSHLWKIAAPQQAAAPSPTTTR